MIVNLELLQGQTPQSGKFILNESTIIFFPVTQQHKDVKLHGLSYEDDYGGNAVAGTIAPGRVEIRFHKDFSDELIRAIWSGVRLEPKAGFLREAQVYYQGRLVESRDRADHGMTEMGDLKKDGYYLAFWFIDGTHTNWFAVVWREPDVDHWKMWMRFRSARRAMKQHDHHRSFLTDHRVTEQEIISRVNLVGRSIAERWEAAMQFVGVHGDGEQARALLSSQPWAHHAITRDGEPMKSEGEQP